MNGIKIGYSLLYWVLVIILESIKQMIKIIYFHQIDHKHILIGIILDYRNWIINFGVMKITVQR